MRDIRYVLTWPQLAKYCLVFTLMILLYAPFLSARITKYVDEKGILRVETVRGSKASKESFHLAEINVQIRDIRLEETTVAGRQMVVVEVYLFNRSEKPVLLQQPWKNLILKGKTTSPELQCSTSPEAPCLKDKIDEQSIDPGQGTSDFIAFQIPSDPEFGRRYTVSGIPSFTDVPLSFSFAWGCWEKNQTGNKFNPNSKNTPNDRKGSVVGDARSKRFHRPDCRYLKNSDRRMIKHFPNRATALKQGYQPCPACKP